MRRVWDKARASRPSIYGKPKEPLLERFLIDSGIQRKGFSGRVTPEHFGAFLPYLLREAKPERPLDLPELHRCMAVALGAESMNYSVSRGSPESWVGALLTLHDVFRTHVDEADTISRVRDFLRRDLTELPFFCDPSSHNFQQRAEGLATGLSIALHFSLDLPMEVVQRQISSLIALIHESAADMPWHYESQIKIGRTVCNRLANHLIHRRRLPGDLRYPLFQPRLVAVLGDGRKDFHITLDDIHLIKNLQSKELRAAVIAMYPWEADHLLKAEEMLARNLPAAKPLGKLFLGELEFALFEWVAGTPLSGLDAPAVWKRYGRIVRQSHECGVALDDAAGRNAIWTGRHVKLIDFEHTWLKEGSEPLNEKERESSLARIRKEKMWPAFEKGYKSL